MNDNNVCVIDTGNSKDFGKIIDKVLIENNWNLKFIINTHSHADHIGGNRYLQNKYNCKIYTSKVECFFVNEPLLEPAMLYSANPARDMHSHLLKAGSSCCEDISLCNIEGIKIINLEGHSLGQIGVVTEDEVCFVGDAYTSEKILNKYAIQYVYDIEKYLKTLEFLKTTSYKYYVPAHGEIETDCKNTIDININNIMNIENEIIETISEGISYNEFMKKIFSNYNIRMNMIQYHLINATIKSFLTKLEKENKIEFIFTNNEMGLKII